MINQIVICIPIKLNSRKAIADALLDKYGTEYVFMGSSLLKIASKEDCEIQIGDRTYFLDNFSIDLVKAIELAGQNTITPTALEKVSHCQQLIYLKSYGVGYDTCLIMANFARVFLNLGGIAVYVESAGLAHQASQWLNCYNSTDVFDIYSLYVGLVEGEDIYYSCGMHNFGKADVALDITEDIGLAIYVMNVFNYYRLTESPILQDGHTFQPDIQCPSYKMELIDDSENYIDSPMFNPYGRWHLTLNI